MEFEDLGRVWRDQGSGTVRRTRTEDLSTALGRAGRYTAGVRRRLGVASVAVALPAVLAYGFLAIRAPNAIAATGAVLLAALAVAVFVRYRAISGGATDPTLPVRQAVQAEVDRLRALERFGRRAAWGRAALAVGTLLLVWGYGAADGDARLRATWAIAFAIGFAVMEVLVRVSRRRRPGYTRMLREELEGWLRGLDELERESGHDRADGGP